MTELLSNQNIYKTPKYLFSRWEVAQFPNTAMLLQLSDELKKKSRANSEVTLSFHMQLLSLKAEV
jgi:hypothetical protein